MNKIYYKGDWYLRCVDTETIPNVESITWFKGTNLASTEVLNTDFANKLENYYERVLTYSFTPTTPII